MNWVENGVAPDKLDHTVGNFVPLLCPFPREAIYNGSGSTSDPSSYTCGGDLQTKAAVCWGLRTEFKHEDENALLTYGRYNPASCVDHSKEPIGKEKGNPKRGSRGKG
jgi:hypothetical protein